MFARPSKLCTTKRVPREAVSTLRHARVCQFTFAVALQMQLKRFPTCSHDGSSNGICITLDTSRHCISRTAVHWAPTTDDIDHERFISPSSHHRLVFISRLHYNQTDQPLHPIVNRCLHCCFCICAVLCGSAAFEGEPPPHM